MEVIVSDTLSDEEFARLFGFCILRPSEETLARAREVNALFDALSFEVGIDSLQVFRKAGHADEEHRMFLSNVASCPEDVLVLAQHILAPDSDERRNRKKS